MEKVKRTEWKFDINLFLKLLTSIEQEEVINIIFVKLSQLQLNDENGVTTIFLNENQRNIIIELYSIVLFQINFETKKKLNNLKTN